MDMDRLSQLQASMDQLVTQFFSSLNYVNRHHDFVPVAGEAKLEDERQESVPPSVFDAALRELAQDIIIRAKQIDKLISSLPELESVQDSQATRLRDLESELEAARAEELAVAQDRRDLLKRCDDLIMQISKDKASIEMGL